MEPKCRQPQFRGSVEVCLLLLSCQAWIDADAAGAANRLGESAIDGPLLLEVAAAHQLEPLLHRFLASREGNWASSEILAGLRRLVERRSLAALHQASDLRRIVTALAAVGIRPALLKGLALAETLYGDPGLRPGNDLDLLVRPAEVVSAWGALEQLGYRPRGLPDWFAIESPVGRQLMRSKGEATFLPDAGGVSVDLHWRLSHQYAAFPLSDELLSRHLQSGRIAGSEVRLLSPALQAVYLAYHGTKHRWTKLCWLADIGMLVRHTDLDWAEVHALARTLGVTGSLGHALCLTERLLGVDRPAALAGEEGLWRRAQREIAQILPQVCRPLPEAQGEDGTRALVRNMAWQVGHQDRWNGRLRILFAQFLPGASDWSVVRLPDLLAAGYFLVRPWRWLARLGSGGRLWDRGGSRSLDEGRRP